MQLVLVMFRSDGERRSFSVVRSMTVIGRREDCDLRIPVGDVSRKHCRILTADNVATIEDLGSSNGTYVNGQRVQQSELNAGDTIGVGPVQFIVQLNGVPDEDEMVAPTANPPAVDHDDSAAGYQTATIDDEPLEEAMLDAELDGDVSLEEEPARAPGAIEPQAAELEAAEVEEEPLESLTEEEYPLDELEEEPSQSATPMAHAESEDELELHVEPVASDVELESLEEVEDAELAEDELDEAPAVETAVDEELQELEPDEGVTLAEPIAEDDLEEIAIADKPASAHGPFVVQELDGLELDGLELEEDISTATPMTPMVSRDAAEGLSIPGNTLENAPVETSAASEGSLDDLELQDELPALAATSPGSKPPVTVNAPDANAIPSPIGDDFEFDDELSSSKPPIGEGIEEVQLDDDSARAKENTTGNASEGSAWDFVIDEVESERSPDELHINLDAPHEHQQPHQ